MSRLTRLGVLLAVLLNGPLALAQGGAGSWRSLAPVPTPRSEVAAAAVDGLIYVVGGFDPGGSAHEGYDPPADRWSTWAPLPKPLNHAAAAGLGGKLYVVGGFDNRTGQPSASLYAYDPSTDAWAERAPLPTARGALGAVGPA